MKEIKLMLPILFSVYCVFSYAHNPSQAICEKGYFPPSDSPKEAVIPSLEEEDPSSEDDNSSNASVKPSVPQGDKQYFPPSN